MPRLRADIRQRGLTLENVASGVHSTTQRETTDSFARGDYYDLVVIARRDQLPGVVPELAANERVPTFLFMLNNDDCRQLLDESKVHFPAFRELYRAIDTYARGRGLSEV